tara:strand:+ start:17768 stop:17908 length:141 start_codon:yes stop_codon:yes gene_type:complete
MTGKRALIIVLSFAFALSVAGCGKKPREVKSPGDTSNFPAQYPTSR